MIGCVLAGKGSLDNLELCMGCAFDGSQFSQLQGISDIFHQHAEEFNKVKHDEMGTKFVIQSTEKNDFEKQHMQPDQSLAEGRQEHDDVSVSFCENTKNIAHQKAECTDVVCVHSRNSINAEGAYHGIHSAVVGCFFPLITHLRGRISHVRVDAFLMFA